MSHAKLSERPQPFWGRPAESGNSRRFVVPWTPIIPWPLGPLRWTRTSCWFSRPTAQSHETKTKRGSEVNPSVWFRHKDNDVDLYPTACPPNRSKNRPQEISLWAGSLQFLSVTYRLFFLISVFLTNITDWLAGRSNFYHFTTGWSPTCSHPLTALIAMGEWSTCNRHGGQSCRRNATRGKMKKAKHGLIMCTWTAIQLKMEQYEEWE